MLTVRRETTVLAQKYNSTVNSPYKSEVQYFLDRPNEVHKKCSNVMSLMVLSRVAGIAFLGDREVLKNEICSEMKTRKHFKMK